MSRTSPLSRGLWPPALAALLAVAAAVAVALTFAPRASADFSTAQCQGTDITGRGASFARDAHSVFRVNFDNTFCPGGPAVDYEALGSGAGRRAVGERSGSNANGSQARNQAPRFGMTDEPPSPTGQGQMELGTDTAGDESEIHVVPAAVGAVPTLVNFPNGCDPNDLRTIDKTPAQDLDNDMVDDDVVRVRFTKTKLERAFASDAGAKTWKQLFPELDNNAACNQPIIRVVRFDDSGTTFTFKDYLDAINPGRGWLTTFASGPNKTLEWPEATVGARADCAGVTGPGGGATDATDQLTSACSNGNGPLVQKLQATDGSIGYSDISTARVAGLAITPEDPEGDDNDTYWTQAQNGSVSTAQSNGTAAGFTEPTADTTRGFRTDGQNGANCGRATFNGVPDSTLGDWSQTSGVDSPAGFGICTFTYGLLFDDYAKAYALIGNGAAEEAKARTVKDYWTNIVSDGGQAVLFGKDYSPLPGNILAISREGVGQVNYNKSGTAGGGGGGGATTPGGTTGGGTNNTGGGTPAPAVRVRSNVFSVERTRIDSRKGTATFRVRLPEPGVLRVLGTAKKPAARRRARRGSVAQSRRRITVGRVRLTVAKVGIYTVVLKPGRAAKRILLQRGKLRVAVRMTYTPLDTASRTMTRTVTLKLRRPARKRG